MRPGYGIWDLAQNGFVSTYAHSVYRGPNRGRYPVPDSWRLRRHAEEAVRSGVAAGYKIVRT